MTPDDAMMRDVRIVHDQCGSYADWMIVSGTLPYGNRHHDYLLGKHPPNYPVPALYDVYPDPEYIVMLYQLALLEQQLRELRGNTLN
jgi:hypothetical protein